MTRHRNDADLISGRVRLLLPLVFFLRSRFGERRHWLRQDVLMVAALAMVACLTSVIPTVGLCHVKCDGLALSGVRNPANGCLLFKAAAIEV